ncbi:hypothetical protein C1I99_17960, partial [Micromonospora deserti]
MQPVGPYRFTHVLGGSPVGKAWAAIDEQGRFVTVAVLETTVAGDQRWREAFAATANSLAQTPGGQAYAYADFSAAAPWVAYPADVGPGAEKLLRALGGDYQPVPTEMEPPMSAPPQQVSAPPQPTSAPPHLPWAMHAGPVPTQPVPSTPQPDSAPPAWDAPTTSTPVQPTSGVPQSPA